MTELHEQLRHAQAKLDAAQRDVIRIKREIDEEEKKIKDQMTVGQNVPVKAAVLSDGRIAVNVYDNKAGVGPAFFIVEPTELD